jgi:hypothetical protein
MATYNFKLNQGTDKVLPLILRDGNNELCDLTGCTCAMQVRATKSSHRSVDTLTTENQRIEIFPEEGKLLVKFPNKKTEIYPVGNLVYDIEITSGDGLVTRILEGVIKVSGEVTRV